MSRLMLLGALRAPIDPHNLIDIMQLQVRAHEAAAEIERLDEKIAVLADSLEKIRHVVDANDYVKLKGFAGAALNKAEKI